MAGEGKINIKIGIIGGSLFDASFVKNAVEKQVNNEYGLPSDAIINGEIEGVPVAILARHNRKHNIMPSMVNYRANLWALKQEGCTHVLATTAVGSLQEAIKPGDIVVCNDIIDRTRKRQDTFFDGEKVVHIPMCPAYNEAMREVVIQALEDGLKLGEKLHKKGVVVCIDGPRFSTKAESNMFRMWGGDIVNMTAYPEVPLAKEAGLLYASIAFVTDYDCWKDTVVNVEEVKATFAKHKPTFLKAVVECVKRIGAVNWDNAIKEARAIVEGSSMK